MNENHELNRLAEKVDRLSDWQASINVERSAEKVRMAHIDKSLEKINIGINRLLWVTVAAVLGSFVTWVMNGGLASVPGA
jgi:hypothetical protein